MLRPHFEGSGKKWGGVGRRGAAVVLGFLVLRGSDS